MALFSNYDSANAQELSCSNCSSTISTTGTYPVQGTLGDCIIDVNYSIKECDSPPSREIRITGISKSSIGDCPYTEAQLMKQAITATLANAKEIFSMPSGTFDVSVVMPTCWAMQMPSNTFMAPCPGYACCRGDFTLNTIQYGEQTARYITASSMTTTSNMCTGGEGPCGQYMCPQLDNYTPGTLLLASEFHIDHQDCQEGCYWKVVGNTNTNGNNFLGTIYPEPLIIKTGGFERMRFFGLGKIGVNIGLSAQPLAMFDVRGGILTGGLDKDNNYQNGEISIYPNGGGGIYHLYNTLVNTTDGNTLRISAGGRPGLFFQHEAPPCVDPETGEQCEPQIGLSDIVNFEHWGKKVCIGCDPTKINPSSTGYYYNFAPLSISNAKMGPEIVGKFTVSDEPIMYWNSSTPAFERGAMNPVIMRLERRNVTGEDDHTNYTLISAGHKATETFIVKANGNVGINEDNPQYDLDIDGIAHITDKVIIGEPCNTSGVEDHKLSVKGTIIAQEVYVTQEYWSDYVFDDNYNLLTLKEIEEFIQKHKHLPNVPSQKEISEGKLSIGKMQAKLLEKIEEITLHLLELSKENEILKQKIQKLEKK